MCVFGVCVCVCAVCIFVLYLRHHQQCKQFEKFTYEHIHTIAELIEGCYVYGRVAVVIGFIYISTRIQ